MQATGYVIIKGRKVLVLVRPTKYGRTLKVRASGKDGSHFEDETNGLAESPELTRRLLAGQTITV
jgi:hypothetical protein